MPQFLHLSHKNNDNNNTFHEVDLRIKIVNLAKLRTVTTIGYSLLFIIIYSNSLN